LVYKLKIFIHKSNEAKQRGQGYKIFKISYCFLVNDPQEKVIDAHPNINSLTINGQTNLSFNLRPNKYIDR